MGLINFFKNLLFKTDNTTKDITNTNELQRINPSYAIEDTYAFHQFYKKNPNLFVNTEYGFCIDKPSVYETIYQTDYQFKTAIKQKTTKISAIDVVFEPATEKNDYTNKKSKRRLQWKKKAY